MNLNWYCLQYVGVFGPIRKTGRKIPKRGIHVLIIEYIGKKEAKTVFFSCVDKVELAYKWSGKRTVFYTKKGRKIAIEIINCGRIIQNWVSGFL